jgi:hypothetical protein
MTCTYTGEIRPMTLIIFAFTAEKIQNYLRMYIIVQEVLI